MQAALSALVTSSDAYFNQLREGYDQRRQLLSEGLRKLGLAVNRIEGAYYVFARIPQWWRGSGSELNAKLIEGGFVAGVPGDVFYGPGGGNEFLRYTFCKQRSTLELALERLAIAFDTLRSSRCV